MVLKEMTRPLSPALTEEHEMLQAAVRDFAQREIASVAAEYDESGEFPIDTVRKMGEMGLMGIEMPEEYGGAGMDTLAHVLTMIEIAKADASHSTILSVNNSLYCNGILWFGSEAQKHEWIRPVASGQEIGAYSLTEPMSGSDAGNMASRAVLNEAGTHYIINGRKSWVTSAPFADRIVLFTMTAAEEKHRGITCFLIDASQPGFSRGKTEPKLGIRASATSEVIFENYACPVENVLGGVGQGFKIAMTVLDAGRIGIAAQALGIAEAAYEAALDYAREREAFGAPIGSYQMIQQKIADMKTRIEAGRALIYQTIIAKERALANGGRYTTEATVAKLFCSEAAAYVTDEALQIHGGMGYSRELPLERYYRDARITRIYEGTSEIQRMVIARNELGLR
ncbi:MAG: acyl-CoA dehydrogenase family protein [Chloroflexota bacterium]|nr:acyl-CoA dehydrogenase family protein [Chloroflexota bacterium]MDE2909998.1 acyl-CoA dehydrogenase family protein [Chloroflexota bacterium]